MLNNIFRNKLHKLTALALFVTCVSLTSCKIVDPANERTDSLATPNENQTPDSHKENNLPLEIKKTITRITIESLSETVQTQIPVTFGHVFHKGEIKAGTQLALRAKGSLNEILPSQIDKKATHSDGSLRHAVITTIIPELRDLSTQEIEIVTVDNLPVSTPIKLDEVLAGNLSGAAILNIAGVAYSASIKDALKNHLSTTWLNGPQTTEWITSAPLIGPDGKEHPHLTGRFNIRAYSGLQSIRVDFVIENNWAYVPDPQNFTYDVKLELCGKTVYEKNDLTHYHHARWRKTFWCGEVRDIHVKHDIDYLIDSYAVPNYDRSLVIPEEDLQSMEASWTGSKTQPMGIGFANDYMPATGAHPDIGPLPRWSVRYLLSQDKRAKEAMLGTDTLAGSWSVHYRDKETDLPVSLDKYPKMTIKGNFGDTRNSDTGAYEAFPTCGGNCLTPYNHDVAHQPSFAYLSYLITGDYYMLEELHFWANYNLFQSNPRYRNNSSGLLKQEQVRGQAWALRTLAHAVYITPDNDPMKEYFAIRLNINLDWYNKTYTDNSNANLFGILVNGYAFPYNNGRAMSPWMDDFFTWSVGHVSELGFAGAHPLLAWKAKFPINRMTNPDYCWLFASQYSLNMRDDSSSPLYNSWAEVYSNQFSTNLTTLECNSQAMADYRGEIIGSMSGYSQSPTGYPSNLQIALAVSANKEITNGIEAWDIFASRTVKPDYSRYPNFAIVPRLQ